MNENNLINDENLPEVVWHAPRSKGKFPHAIFYSVLEPQFVRRFTATVSNLPADSQRLRVRCAKCKQAKELHNPANEQLGPVPSGWINNNQWLFDPDAGHWCSRLWPQNTIEQLRRSSVNAKDVVRRVCHDARGEASNTGAAYNKVLLDLRNKYPDEEYDENKDAVPAKKSMKKTILKNLRFNKPAIPNPRVIPDAYKNSVVPRPVGLGAFEQAPANLWLRHVEEDADRPPFLIMANVQTLKCAQKATHLAGDGTFTHFPSRQPFTGFVQMYIIHAIFNVLPYLSQSVPVVVAFLPAKCHQTYVTLFTKVHEFIVAEFGNTGDPKTFHADHEPAAIQAFKQVFTDFAAIMGCLFHTKKAVNNKMKKLELTRAARDNRDLRHWLRAFVACAMAPPQMALSLTLLLVQHFPQPGPELVNNRIVLFIRYFRKNYIPRIDEWNHWNNTGPRTTNHAEGYNSTLSTFLPKNPPLADFLSAYGERMLTYSRDADWLRRGNAPSRRRQRDIDNDMRINEAKTEFLALCNQRRDADVNLSVGELLQYVGRQAHNIGMHQPNLPAAQAPLDNLLDEPEYEFLVEALPAHVRAQNTILIPIDLSIRAFPVAHDDAEYEEPDENEEFIGPLQPLPNNPLVVPNDEQPIIEEPIIEEPIVEQDQNEQNENANDQNPQLALYLAEHNAFMNQPFMQHLQPLAPANELPVPYYPPQFDQYVAPQPMYMPQQPAFHPQFRMPMPNQYFVPQQMYLPQQPAFNQPPQFQFQQPFQNGMNPQMPPPVHAQPEQQ